MKLVKQELNYSRTTGCFTIEQGRSTWEEIDAVANNLAKLEGIEAVEAAEDEGWISLVYSKAWHDWDSIREAYKAAK